MPPLFFPLLTTYLLCFDILVTNLLAGCRPLLILQEMHSPSPGSSSLSFANRNRIIFHRKLGIQNLQTLILSYKRLGRLIVNNHTVNLAALQSLHRAGTVGDMQLHDPHHNRLLQETQNT